MKTIINFLCLLIISTNSFSQVEISWSVNRDSTIEISNNSKIVFANKVNTLVKAEQKDIALCGNTECQNVSINLIIQKDSLMLKNYNADSIKVLWRNESTKIGVVIGTTTKELTVKRIKEKDQGADPKDGSSNSPVSKNINVYYDALRLFKGDSITKILEKYKLDVTDNLFIPGKFKSESRSNNANTGLLNSIGNIEVTPIADGLAQFLVASTKKELSIAFFQDFKETIKDENYKDLQILFPSTAGHLNLIDEKIYDFKPYLNGLKTNAVSDFKMIPFNLSGLLSDSKTHFSKALKPYPEIKYGIGLSFNLLEKTHEHKNFGKALEKLVTDDKDYFVKTDSTEKIKQSIELLRLLSFALRDSVQTDSTYYISSDKIEKLVKDKELLKTFMALTIASSKLESSEVVLDPSLYELLNQEVYVNKLDSIVLTINGIKEASNLFFKANVTSKEEKILLYCDGMDKVLDAGTSIMQLTKIYSGKVDTTIALLKKSNNLFRNLYLKNHAISVLQALDFYNYLPEIKKNDEINNLRRKLYKYGTFLAHLSQIDDAESVNELLEQYAAPVGSYRDKSSNKVTLAFDSYVGLGFSKTNGFNTEFKKDSIGFSVGTPIGISVSWPSRNGKSSFTLMPSIIDLGPLVSYRFLNSDNEIAKIYLKEIFSPGLFLSYGFSHKFPLFLNLGFQRPAILGEVGSEVNTYKVTPYNFLSASVNVNIPLLTLFHR